MDRYMIYGATGYTGRLIAREAARRGQRPLLGGRSHDALAALGEELGLPWLVAPLDDPEALSPVVTQALTRSVRRDPQPLAEPHVLDRQVAVDQRRHVGVDDGRGRALVLAVFGQNVGREGDVDAGQPGAQGRADVLLVLRPQE